MGEWETLSGGVGWVLMLLGFLLDRRALNRLTSKVDNRVRGHHNHIANHVHQSVSSSASGGGTGALATWSAWATIGGLLLTLWPMVRGWLLA